ncbi:hypothetical protein RhiirA4_481157 [Rhizophagus irregularis]|uniref:Uncharacterized protein n=1 Tax=Rhizophagus irregularis TaxID=588596 RepID=A0A2I1HJ47_9GLOM|nr:hypothetical protein RhiirA4_481157 [Rhizophagus irregularis]
MYFHFDIQSLLVSYISIVRGPGVLVLLGYLSLERPLPDLTKVKKEKEDFKKKFENLLEMGTYKSLEKGVCQLLSHNMNLESSKGSAKAVFEEARQVLFEECNIILTNVSTNISTFDPSFEEVD